MKTANLIFPHQLFESSPMLELEGSLYLVEEFLFFKQYRFHKQKIAFHRASMKKYQGHLKLHHQDITYIEATEERSDIRLLITELAGKGVERIRYIDPSDNWLENQSILLCSGAGSSKTRIPFVFELTG